jgi:hypothetical protein
LARRLPNIVGFLGIAAAPDFTERRVWAQLDVEQRQLLIAHGRLEVPSPYGGPTVLTRRLIEDGRANLVLPGRIAMPWPVRLVYGTADDAVSLDTTLALMQAIDGPDVRLTLIKDADHRLSDPASLSVIETLLTEILEA